jgi:hypothetical protein
MRLAMFGSSIKSAPQTATGGALEKAIDTAETQKATGLVAFY